MTYCACPACRARDERRFWRIVRANDPTGTFWETLETATIAARVGAYGYTPVLNLPPIPEWTGEPTEWKGTA